MGFLDKLAFWKRKETLPPGLQPASIPGGADLGLPGEAQLGLPPMGGPAAPGQMPDMPPAMPGAMPSAMEPEPASPAFAVPKLEPVQEQPRPMGTPAMGSKEIELVSLKLDQLKTTLDVINQRIANLEKIAEQAQHPKW